MHCCFTVLFSYLIQLLRTLVTCKSLLHSQCISRSYKLLCIILSRTWPFLSHFHLDCCKSPKWSSYFCPCLCTVLSWSSPKRLSAISISQILFAQNFPVASRLHAPLQCLYAWSNLAWLAHQRPLLYCSPCSTLLWSHWLPCYFQVYQMCSHIRALHSSISSIVTKMIAVLEQQCCVIVIKFCSQMWIQI